MLPVRASRPQKLPSLMEKGLVVLQRMANRDRQGPEPALHGRQCSVSKPAQAVRWSFRRRSGFQQDACPEDASYRLDTEELRKVFLRRPDCPQFSTRATSMSRFGSAMTASLPEEVCVGSQAGKVAEGSPSSPQGSDTQVDVDGDPPPFSKSAFEISHSQTRSASQTPGLVTSSPVLAQSHPGQRVPWYIAVIHKKDHCLSILGEEVKRLSELEEQVQQKDEEIMALQEEREALQEQLKLLLRSKGQGTPVCQGMEERAPESVPGPQGKLNVPEMVCRDGDGEEPQCWRQEECAMVDTGGRGLGAGGREETGLEGEAERPADEGAPGGAEEQEEDLALEEEEEQETQGHEDSGWRRVSSLDESFEEELMAQLEEYEQVIQEFRVQLDVSRARHALATGTIGSLRRQMDLQESQVQKASADNEALRKELRERKQQLQAMTDKFSNLRDDKKLQEVMGLIEKDNLVLREQVWELQQELTKREHTISESHAQVNQLQDQLNQSQKLLQRQKQLQEETQSKMELVQQAEQHTRVALESTQSRLERLRNKILQATFSSSGIKSLATEISDNDILESLQRIITEKTEYYHQLKQRGVRVPPLQQSELLSSPSKSKKVASK